MGRTPADPRAGGVPARRVALLAAALVALVAAVPLAPAQAEGLRRRVVDPGRAPRQVAQQRWLDVATVFDRAGAGTDPLYLAADAASELSAAADESGWSSPKVPGLVSALAATANPDGGYGLGREWDAFQDGTVNPSTTSYAATTVGHVGPVLLAGYAAGAVPTWLVTRALDSILDLPRSMQGACIPYSNAPADLREPCVWNVHFGAAAWVRRASAATGYRTADASALVAAALRLLPTARQDPATGFWPYSSAVTAPQDLGHQMWTAQSVDDLRGTSDAVRLMTGRRLWRTQAAALHDVGVASVLSAIALIDCSLASDPLVLTYAGATDRGTPYVYRALGRQARRVVKTCFTSTASARDHANSARSAGGVLAPPLG